MFLTYFIHIKCFMVVQILILIFQNGMFLINAEYMFYSCFKFKSNLSKWNTRNFKYAREMFCGCSKFNCNLSNWNTSNLVDFKLYFAMCSSPKSNFSKWEILQLKLFSMNVL